MTVIKNSGFFSSLLGGKTDSDRKSKRRAPYSAGSLAAAFSGLRAMRSPSPCITR